MNGRRLLNRSSSPAVLGAILDARLDDLWAQAAPLPGGRGSARFIKLAGESCILKQERRGGWAGKILPHRFVSTKAFREEWLLGLRLADEGLAVEPLAIEFVPSALLFQAYTLSRAVLPSTTLLDLWREGRMEASVLEAAGKRIARLHQAGVLHGDLNAGNILFKESGDALFLDLRHSKSYGAPPPAKGRRANLARLGRSLHKLHATRGYVWPARTWESLAEGYSAGWGSREPWLDGLARGLERGYPFRRMFWGKGPVKP